MSILTKLVDKWYEDEDLIENNLARSETIAYTELLINKTITKDTLRLLGQLQCFHLISPYSNDTRAPFTVPSAPISSTTTTTTTTNQNQYNEQYIQERANAMMLQMIQQTALEQKRAINTASLLLSRLKRLQTSIISLFIPLPPPYTIPSLTNNFNTNGQNYQNNDINGSNYQNNGINGSNYQNGQHPQINKSIKILRSNHSQLISTVGEWLNSVESDEKSHSTFIQNTTSQILLHLQYVLSLYSAKTLISDIIMKDFKHKLPLECVTGDNENARINLYTLLQHIHQITVQNGTQMNTNRTTNNNYGATTQYTGQNQHDSNLHQNNDIMTIEPDIDGLDIESVVYQYDDNELASTTIPMGHNYLSTTNNNNNDENEYLSQNMTVLHGCINATSRFVLNTTIQRLSRGNVHIEWREYNNEQQQNVIAEVVQSYLYPQHTNQGPNQSILSPNGQNQQNQQNDDLALIHKYLPLSLAGYLPPSMYPSNTQHNESTTTTTNTQDNGQNQQNVKDLSQPHTMATFVIIFPFSRHLYSKILKVCTIYRAQLFKMPALQQNIINFNQNSSLSPSNQSIQQRYTSHNQYNINSGSNNVFMSYLQLLVKYVDLIRRAHFALSGLIFTRITTFKALYHLYLDCCSYDYDLLGNILQHESNVTNPQFNTNNTNVNDLQYNQNDDNFGGNIQLESLPSVTNNDIDIHISKILQIATCTSLLTEELSILQAEQYLIPFTTSTATTTNANSLFSPGNEHNNNNINDLYGLSSGTNYLHTLSTSLGATQMFLLRGFISATNLSFLKEQFESFDDDCNDGYEVKPIIHFVHIYNREWITTPTHLRPLLLHKQDELTNPTATSLHDLVLDPTAPSTSTLTTSSKQLTNKTNTTTSTVSTQFSQFQHTQSAFEIPPEPPTLFPSLPLYLPSQELVNTYGVPSYKELNPANLVISTFPFIFAVMFGDFIHGMMLTCAALTVYWLMYKQDGDVEVPQHPQFYGKNEKNSKFGVNFENGQNGHNFNNNYQNDIKLDYDENNTLLQHNNDLYYDKNQSASTMTTKPYQYTIQLDPNTSTTTTTITTQYYQSLLNITRNNPVYKSIAFRRGGIIWFIMIALMSTYVGLIYNDAASNPLFLFTSSLHQQKVLSPSTTTDIDYNKYSTYIFGIDPAWMHTKQELTFLNSYKMKMAIILGILHLYSGIICQIFNHMYFKHYIHIILSTLPQLLLLTSTFGYMSLLIIMKWMTNYNELVTSYYNKEITQLWEPVSIIQTMINMFLAPGGTIPQSMLIYNGQSTIQFILVIIAGLCVPFLFLAEPLYTFIEHKHWYQQYIGNNNQNNNNDNDIQYSNRYKDDMGANIEAARFLDPKKLSINGSNGGNNGKLSPNGSFSNKNNHSPTYSTFDNDTTTTNPLDTIDNGNDDSDSDNDNTTKPSTTQLLLSPTTSTNRSTQTTTTTTTSSSLQLPLLQPKLSFTLSTERNKPNNTISTTNNNNNDSQLSSSTSSLSDATEEEQLDPFNEHYTLSTHFVHHGIHTIEFVLGIVSNTASYLRLWALSLAHMQLSQVFWSQLITNIGFNDKFISNPFILCIVVAIWLLATIGVLLLMDSMECLLHAVRLIWVEFNSKFATLKGYNFAPFSLYPNNAQSGK